MEKTSAKNALGHIFVPYASPIAPSPDMTSHVTSSCDPRETPPSNRALASVAIFPPKVHLAAEVCLSFGIVFWEYFERIFTLCAFLNPGNGEKWLLVFKKRERNRHLSVESSGFAKRSRSKGSEQLQEIIRFTDESPLFICRR